MEVPDFTRQATGETPVKLLSRALSGQYVVIMRIMF